MSIHDLISELNSALNQLTATSKAATDHAAAGSQINGALVKARESVANSIKGIWAECPDAERFKGILGVVLADYYRGTVGTDKSRTALRKALQRGISVGSEGKCLSLIFPRKWDTNAVVRVTLDHREEPSQLDMIKGLIQGLNDVELAAVVSYAAELRLERESMAAAADAARQYLAEQQQAEQQAEQKQRRKAA